MSGKQDRCRLCPTTSVSVDSKMVMCFDANPSTSQAVYLSTNSVADVLNQHFGFELNQEHDAMAFVCKTCWLKVDEFHQFFQSVMAMYETERSSDPLNVEHKCDIPLDIPLDPALDCGDEAVEVEESETAAEDNDGDYSGDGDDDFDEAELDFPDDDSWADDFDMFFDEDYYDDDDDDDGDNDDNLLEPKAETPPSASCMDDESDDNVDGAGNNANESGPLLAEPKTEVPPSASAAVTSNDFVDDDDFCWPDNEVAVNKDEPAKDSVEAAVREKRIREEDELIRKHIPMHCHLCGVPYETEDEAHLHMAEHNRRGYLICCDQKFYYRSKLLEHCNWHQSLITQSAADIPPRVRSRLCIECNELFTSISALKQHCTEAHGSDQPRTQCNVCGKWYKTVAIMMRHKSTHRDEQWVCEQCGHIALTKAKLSGHRYFAHRGCKHKCPECGLMLKSPNDLRDHISSLHERRLLHLCPHCPRSFATQRQMYYHRTKYHVKEAAATRRELAARTAADAKRNKAEQEAAIANLLKSSKK